MLNLLNLFSLKRSPLLSQFHILLSALLCPAISCPAISCPTFSCPVIWSIIFMSCNFMPCTLVRQFHVRHFHVQHFQRPRLLLRLADDCLSVIWIIQNFMDLFSGRGNLGTRNSRLHFWGDLGLNFGIFHFA